MYWPPGEAQLDEAALGGQTEPLSPSCGSCEEDGCPACRGGRASARSPSPRRRFGESPSVSPPPARSRSRSRYGRSPSVSPPPDRGSSPRPLSAASSKQCIFASDGATHRLGRENPFGRAWLGIDREAKEWIKLKDSPPPICYNCTTAMRGHYMGTRRMKSAKLEEFITYIKEYKCPECKKWVSGTVAEERGNLECPDEECGWFAVRKPKKPKKRSRGSRGGGTKYKKRKSKKRKSKKKKRTKRKKTRTRGLR